MSLTYLKLFDSECLDISKIPKEFGDEELSGKWPPWATLGYSVCRVLTEFSL